MLLTKTTELAVRALLSLALDGSEKPTSRKHLAEALECSSTYLSKTLGLLVRANILSSTKGVNGGVQLTRPAAEISILEVFEACQGVFVPNYCQEVEGSMVGACAFHRAMKVLHGAIVDSLSQWSLEDLVADPVGTTAENADTCKMLFRGAERFRRTS